MFQVQQGCLVSFINVCLPTVWECGRCEDGQICCSFIFSLSSNQPTAPTAMFTFVVAADGSWTVSVHDFLTGEMKNSAVDQLKLWYLQYFLNKQTDFHDTNMLGRTFDSFTPFVLDTPHCYLGTLAIYGHHRTKPPSIERLLSAPLQQSLVLN